MPAAPPARRRWRLPLGPAASLPRQVADEVVVPAWEHVTDGESTVPVLVALAAAGVLHATLPAEVVSGARWWFPVAAGLVMLFVALAYGLRFVRVSPALRSVLLALVTLVSALNIAATVHLVHSLLGSSGINASGVTASGTESSGIDDAGRLLWGGGVLWATNVVVFALWYWLFDRGGPVRRAQAPSRYPDLLFPQMATPELADPDWAPNFWDYLYTSFTASTAFSPTDVMPLSRWTKLVMMVQSAVALTLAVLVVARAVNIL